MPLEDGKSLFFLFGSQTGNAENICSMFYDEATNKTKAYPKAQIMTLDQAVKKDSVVFLKETAATLVIVCSTYGDGDFPDANAANFRRWLKKSSTANLDLSHVRYTVLALGDSNYSTFCGAARTIDSKFQSMGATKFYKRGEADDGIPEGLESVINPWGEGLWPALHNLASTAEKASVLVADSVVPDLSTPKDTLILYGGGLSRRLAVALFELIVRFGGKCDLHPISYLKASNVPRRPQQLVVLYDEGRAAKDGTHSLLATLSQAASGSPVTSDVDPTLANWMSPKFVSKESPLHYCVLDVRLNESNPISVPADSFVSPSSIIESFSTLKHSKTHAPNSILELNSTTSDGKKTSAVAIALSIETILTWFHNTLKAMPGVLSDEKVTHSVVSATLKDWCASPHLLTHLQDNQNEDSLDDVTHSANQFSDKDVILKSFMAPVAILYGDDGPGALEVAHSVGRNAKKNGFPYSVTADMGNPKTVAFPRSATFIFVIGPRRPKSFAKLMKMLVAMQEAGTRLNDSVRFAIFGFDDRRISDHYNSCALELEHILLNLGALKIHATGLADVSSDTAFSKVRSQWDSQLWISLKQPKPTKCYIDDEMVSSCEAPAGGNFFPWESVPIVKEVLPKMRILILHNSTGMSHAAARQLAQDGHATGFADCAVQDILHYSVEAIQRTHHIIFVAESSQGKLTGCKEFMKFLRHPNNDPDLFSQIRFAVLGLEADNSVITAEGEAKKAKRKPNPIEMLSEYMQILGASKVFPILTISHMSQLLTRALPWCRGVWGALSSMAAADPPTLLDAVAEASSGVLDLLGNSPPTTYSYSTPLDIIATTSPAMKSQSRRKILFLYGSVDETISAEAIARAAHREALARGIAARVAPMKHFQRMNFLSSDLVVFMCDSVKTGRGFPENAKRFGTYIQNDHPSSAFSKVQFMVLGIGSSSDGVEHFCRAARYLDSRLSELGSTRFRPTVLLNREETLESSVDLWKTSFTSLLDEVLLQTPSLSATQQSLTPLPFIELPGALAFQSGNTPLRGASANNSVTSSPQINSTQAAPTKILVMYGSQTGNAQAIAEMIHGGLVDRNFDAQIGVLKNYNKLNWQDFELVIIVCSTYGEGDFPENAAAFHRYIRQRGHPEDLLKGMQYAVLALGDTNYSRFCNAGKTIDRRMEDLGAKRVFARGDADDGTGMEDVVEPWKEGIFNMVQKTMRPKLPELDLAGSTQDRKENSGNFNRSTSSSAALAALSSSAIVEGEIANPLSSTACNATIKAWRFLTTPESTSEVIHLSLKLPKGTTWTPGTAIAIMPANEESQVNSLLNLLQVQPNDPFLPPDSLGVNSMFPSSPVYQRLRYPVTNKEVLMHFVSLQLHNRQILKVLKEHATHPQDRVLVGAWSQPSNFEDWKSTRCKDDRRPTIVTVFENLKECKVPFRHVIEHLMPLQPRYYSIASANCSPDSTLDIAFKVVCDGVCTNWLKQKCLQFNLNQPVEIAFRFRETSEFSMPADQLIPMILIGPGTGVAPFISFLQHREHQQVNGSSKIGETHLFFGCRSSAYDYLFEEELEGFSERKTLTGLHVAFSQEPSGGLWYGGSYVQDKLQGVASHLCNLIMKESAYIYVCGDANSMARDVHRVLIDMLVEYNRWQVEEASAFVEKLHADGRYQRDIWS